MQLMWSMFHTFKSLATQEFTLVNDQSILQTTSITLAGTTGNIDWGDDNGVVVTAEQKTYTHDYSGTGIYNIKLNIAMGSITRFILNNQDFISGDISFLYHMSALIEGQINGTAMTGDLINLKSKHNMEYFNASDIVGLGYTFTQMYLSSVISSMRAKNLGWDSEQIDTFLKGIARAYIVTLPYLEANGTSAYAYALSTQKTGSWKFWMKKKSGGKSGNSVVQFMSTENANRDSSQGYAIELDKSEEIQLQRYDNGSIITLMEHDPGSMADWHEYEVIRDGNSWLVKFDGVAFTPNISGTNPVIDSSPYIGDSDYAFLDMDGSSESDSSDGIRQWESDDVQSIEQFTPSTEDMIAIGFNEISNGDFFQGISDWANVKADLSVVNGQMMIVATDDFGYGYQDIIVETQKLYKLDFHYWNELGDVAQYQVYDLDNGASIIPATDLPNTQTLELFTIDFAPPSGCTNVRIILVSKLNGQTSYFDNVVVKVYEYLFNNWSAVDVSGAGNGYITDKSLAAIASIEAGYPSYGSKYGVVACNKLGDSLWFTNDQAIFQTTTITIDAEIGDVSWIRWDNIELITNGNFIAWTGSLPNEVPDGWIVANNDLFTFVTESGGGCRFFLDGQANNGCTLSQDALIIGLMYEITIPILAYTSGKLYVTNGAQLLGTIIDNTFEVIFEATDVDIKLEVDSTIFEVDANLTIGSVSVKEVVTIASGENVYTHDYSLIATHVITMKGNLNQIRKFITNDSFLGGSVNFLSNLKGLTELDISGTGFTGEMTGFAARTRSLDVINVGSVGFDVQLYPLQHSYVLRKVIFPNTDGVINLASLAKNLYLTHIDATDSTCYGSPSNLINNLVLIELIATRSAVTYATAIFPRWDGATLYLDDINWSSEDVDNMIIDMATSGSLNLILILNGASNGARTSASDTAKGIVEANGGTVTTN